MTTKYEIVPTTEAHIEQLAANMREADKDEIWAAVRRSPVEGLRMSCVVSRNTTMTGLANGEAACIFGVYSPTALSDKAYPWMLSSDILPNHWRKFLRDSRLIVAAWRDQYGLLQNFVDARNELAIKWLQWLGFDIKDPIPFGPDQLPFHPFEMRR